MDIIEFEEARQNDGETLAQFMQRLKGLGHRAFSEFDANGMQQRIIWRFLDGVKDKDIRSSIIKERWMKDRKHPKPYAEVLKIAETAHLNKMAANATGATAGHAIKKVAVMNKDGAKVAVPSKEGSSRDHTPRTNKGNSYKGKECFFCHKKHSGGWKNCDERMHKNPN